MRAIIIDDEQGNINNLKSLLKRHCGDVELLGFATDKDAGEQLIKSCHPELLFLDIQLGRDSAFDLLKSLSVRNFEVIFVTAFDHYGLQAIKFAALDYLLKPVDIDELVSAVAKADAKIKLKNNNFQIDFLLNHLKKEKDLPERIALPQQKEVKYVLIDQILRCEADDTYTTFHLINKEKIMVSKPLKEYDNLLQSHGFIRTHQSHLINKRFIKSWLKQDGGILILENEEHIPVSKVNRDKVRALLGGGTLTFL